MIHQNASSRFLPVLNRYELVLWDFDGTIVDTLAHAARIYNQFAEQYDYQPIDDPHRVRGLTLTEFLKRHRVPAWRVPFLFQRFLSELQSNLDGVRTYSGIAETIQAIKSTGIRQCVVSSNSEANISQCLKQEQLQHQFESIVGYSRLFGKENAIRKAARAASVDLDRTLYVGDEVRDIEAGLKAGVDVVSVTWGLNNRSLLGKHQPRFLIDRPEQILTDCLFTKT